MSEDKNDKPKLPAFDPKLKQTGTFRDQDQNPKYIFHNIEGSQLFFEATLTNVTFNNVKNASPDQKQELEALKQELLEELKKVPPEQQEEADAVATQMEDFVSKAEAEKPNKTLLKISGEGLIKAAETVSKVAPYVAVAAGAIVRLILGL